MATHYEILGVPSDADLETIRRAYVALAKANHPDRRQAEDDDRRSRADERIRAANTAWHDLREPGRRAAYDRSLRPRSTVGDGRVTATASAGFGQASRDRAGVVGARPAPPSGIVVPASQASWWRYAPIVVILVVLAAVLVGSAFATSGGTGPAATPVPEVTPAVGECVLVVSVGGRAAPARVGCGTDRAARVVARVDTPRPCPTDTAPVAIPEREITLCLASVR